MNDEQHWGAVRSAKLQRTGSIPVLVSVPEAIASPADPAPGLRNQVAKVQLLPGLPTPMFQGDGALHKRLPRAVRARPSAPPVGPTVTTPAFEAAKCAFESRTGNHPMGRSPSGDGCGVTNRRAEFDPLAPYSSDDLAPSRRGGTAYAAG